MLGKKQLFPAPLRPGFCMLGKLGERWSLTSLQGQLFQAAGAGLWGEAQSGYFPATLYFSWEFMGISNRQHAAPNRRVCVLTNPTKQHSKVTMRISYSPPLPLRWKPPWYYFKIHLAI